MLVHPPCLIFPCEASAGREHGIPHTSNMHSLPVSGRCPKRDQDHGASLVDWSQIHQLQRRPDPRDTDASPGTAP